MSDNYSNYSCDWCSKSDIVKDKKIKTVDDIEYSLCKDCNQYDSKVDRDAAIASIIRIAMSSWYNRYGYPWIY